MRDIIKRAVGYVRTSSYLNPKASIPNQHRLIEEYCENNNIPLKEIYVDESKTATKVEDREGYLKLKTDLEYGDIDMVIVTFFDRLARESFEFILTVLDLDNRGIEIVSVSEDLSSKRMSPIHLAMIAFQIEHENKQRTERIQGAIHENRKKGIYNLTNVPFGYKKDEESRLIIDRDKEIVVKQIFETYINTKSIYDTAIRFENIDLEQIITILENKTYTGFIYTKSKTFKENPEYIQCSLVKHESIIDEMTFEKATNIRKVERKPPNPKNKSYLLKHIFKCPKCSSIMHFKIGKYYCRSCKDERTKFSQESLEKKYIDYLNSPLFELDILAENEVSHNPKIDEIENRRKKIEEKFSKAKISLVNFQEEINSLDILIRESNKISNPNSSFPLKYEFKDLVRNKSWLKLRRRFSNEKIYITLDEFNSNIKIIKNG